MNNLIIIIVVIIVLILLFVISNKKESNFSNNSNNSNNSNEICEPIKVDKFFLLSLEKSIDRRKTFLDSFDKLNIEIPLEIIWAKDTTLREEADKYKDLVRSDMYENMFLYDAGESRPDHTYFNSGALGCYLGHLDFYERSISQGLKYTMIFEDNIKLNSDFSEELDNALEKLGNDFDACFFHCWDNVSEPVIKCGRESINKVKWISSTKCYLINVETFKKYIPLLIPMENHIDQSFEKLIYNGANVYLIKLKGVTKQFNSRSLIKHSSTLTNNRFRYLPNLEHKNIKSCN